MTHLPFGLHPDPRLPPGEDTMVSHGQPLPVDASAADAAMRQIWSEWFSFYQAHFRAQNVAISMADQMAFYEIAQPILRPLTAAIAVETKPVGDWVKWTDVRDFVIHRADQLRGQYPRQIFWALADDMSNKLRGVCASEDASPQPLLDAPRVTEALEWYAEQARLCRLIHSGGDIGRANLAADGGKKALAALSALQSDGEGR